MTADSGLGPGTGAGSYSAVVRAALEPHQFEITESPVWCQARPTEHADRRKQGWKLHLSVGTDQASDLLQVVLPALRSHRVMFKVASDQLMLYRLNEGQAGLTQAGKFMTIYPIDDAAAVEVAAELDRLTADFAGPWIPSDRPLHELSRVHYRFGTFFGTSVTRANGHPTTFLDGPDGLVADERGDVYVPKSWVVDPFLAAGVARPLPQPDHVIDGRYVIVDTLHRSPRGAVQLGVDTVDKKPVILKRAHRWGAIAEDGRDAVDRLKAEQAALATIGSHPGFPSVEGLVYDNDDAILILEDLEGEGLDTDLTLRRLTGEPLAPVDALLATAHVADLLGVMHHNQLIHRDCKPGNTRRRSDGTLVLIDHEMAGPPGSIDTSGARGTRGYVAPERRDNRPGRYSDDVYSLGVMLHELLTLEEPWGISEPYNLIDLNPADARPAIPAEAIEARDALLSAESARPVDGEAAAALLRAAAETLTNAAVESSPREPPQLCRAAARDVAAGLVRWFATQSVSKDGGLRWRTGPSNPALLPGDLYAGEAGVLLALSLAAQAGIDGAAMLVAGAAAGTGERQLVPAPYSEGSLFIGELGVALALDHAADALGDASLGDLAARRSEQAQRCTNVNVDVVAGAAGRAIGHLLLNDRTGCASDLQAAVAATKHLAQEVSRDPDQNHGDIVGWRLPDVGPGLSGGVFRGYAHGTAGIADALLAVGARTNDASLLELAAEAVVALVAAAERTADGNACNWFEPDRAMSAQGIGWGFGATGIVGCLQRAAALDLGLDAQMRAKLNATLDGAIASTETAVFLSPSWINGLAGSVNALLNAGRADAARHHGFLLNRFIHMTDDVAEVVVGASALGPDLTGGAAGVLVAMARLADPAIDDPFRPHYGLSS